MSIDAFVDELDRAHARVTRWSFTPDALRVLKTSAARSPMGAGRFSQRPRRKRWCCSSTRLPGPNAGARFEHLATIIDHLDGSSRVGVCLDTCHLVASARHRDRGGYASTFEAFDRLVGLIACAYSTPRLEATVRQSRRSSRAHW
jgi:deoxyribonuclease-4